MKFFSRALSQTLRLRLIIVITISTMLAACGGGAGNDTNTPSQVITLQDIQINLENDQLVYGLTTRAFASALYSDNNSEDLSGSAQWFSSNASVATIDSDGQITTLTAGTSVISAVLKNQTASATLTVDDATLLSLNISPANAFLVAGIQQQFKASGEYNNGAIYDVTSLSNWSSNNTAIVSIAESSGIATAVSVGTATITASLGNISNSNQVNVSTATLSRIEISTSQNSLPAGTELQLHSTGIFSDNSVLDLTNRVSWSSSDKSIATINSSGLISALASGTTQISLSYLGETATKDITVEVADIVSIGISPGDPNLVENSNLQLYATAIYSDGSSLDVTDQSTWVSDDETIATIGNTTSNTGKVTAVSIGSTNISAYFDGLNQQSVLTVTAATLKNMEISPINPNIALGTRQSFNVTGHYDDGSNRDITDQVVWEISDSSIATADEEIGVFKTVATGNSQIIASLDGVISFASLTVSSATLNSITLSPTDTNIAAGYQSQFTATGNYSDSSNQDITTSVVWNSSNAAVAGISNAINDKGLLTAEAAGTTTISASLDGVIKNTNVTITAEQLTSISIQINSNTMIKGNSQQLTATATFSDDNSVDISEAVIWSSSDNTVAGISNAENDKGLVSALKSGSTTITASLNGVSSNTNVTINNDPDAAVSLSLTTSPNVILNDGSDTTSIGITLQPAESSGSIADNTAINIQVIEGENSSSQTIYTTNGAASFDLSSNYSGFIEIEASVANNITKTGYIYATTNFSSIISRAGISAPQYADTTLLPGSWFSLFIRNLSSRSFNINQYEFSNGENGQTIPGTGINSGKLNNGEQTILIITLDSNQIDQGLTGVMSLTDPGTGQQFDINMTFTSP